MWEEKMKKYSELMYYVTKEEYIKILDFNLCYYFVEFEKVHQQWKYYHSIYQKEGYKEPIAGKLDEYKFIMINKIDSINDKINFIERCELNNINFDKTCKDEIYFISYYMLFNDDINIKIVEY